MFYDDGLLYLRYSGVIEKSKRVGASADTVAAGPSLCTLCCWCGLMAAEFFPRAP